MRPVVATVAGLLAGLLLAAPAPAARPVVVTTGLSSRFVYFGDAVTAHVVVVVDRRGADPRTLRIVPNFGIWRQLTSTRSAVISTGSFVRDSWLYTIECFDPGCLPALNPLIVRLPPVTVSVRSRDGSGVVTTQHGWPALSIAPRFGSSTPGATPNFDLNTELPTATYRIDPGAFAWILDAIALAAMGGTVVVVIVALARRRRASLPLRDERPPIVRAVALVRQAKDRDPDDRRRATGLLARALHHAGAIGLSRTASETAWSNDEPSPSQLERLVQLVETESEERG